MELNSTISSSGSTESGSRHPDKPAQRDLYHPLLVVLTLAWVGVLALWMLFTPGLRSPDAPMHYNSIMRVASGGGWPDPGAATVNSETLQVAKEAGLVPYDRDSLSIFGFTVLIGGTLQNTGPPFVQQPVVPEQQRLIPAFSESEPLPETSDGSQNIDQMTQHPPFYYYFVAGLMRGIGALNWSWDYQLVLISIINIGIMAPLPVITAHTARNLGLSKSSASFAAALLFAFPQLAFVGSSVSNDPAYIMAGAVVIALCAKVLKSEPSWQLVGVVGLALGVSLLTKGFALLLGLTVVLSFAASRNSRPLIVRLVYGASAGLVGVLIGGWWWIRNYIKYGTVQPSGSQSFRPDWGDSTPTIGEFIVRGAKRLLPTFWGDFGVLELPLPAWLIVGLTLMLFVLWASMIFVCRDCRRALLTLATMPVLLIVVLFYESWKSYLAAGLVGGLQGRYLFLVVPLSCAVLSAGIARLLSHISNVAAEIIEGVTIFLAGVLGAYSIYLMARGAYYDSEAAIRINWLVWDEWSPASLSLLRIIMVGTVLAAVLAWYMLLKLRSGKAREHGRGSVSA